MDTTEAGRVLAQTPDPYRTRPYEELVELIGRPTSGETVGAGGVHYQTEIAVVWDSRPQGDIRVIG